VKKNVLYLKEQEKCTYRAATVKERTQAYVYAPLQSRL